MQAVVAHQPPIAYAIRCLSLYDQLELTLELLKQDAWPDFVAMPPKTVCELLADMGCDHLDAAIAAPRAEDEGRA